MLHSGVTSTAAGAFVARSHRDLIKEIDWKYQTRSHPVIGLTRHSSAANTFPECRRLVSLSPSSVEKDVNLLERKQVCKRKDTLSLHFPRFAFPPSSLAFLAASGNNH
ncbi:unnamed protein product [Arctogadus glacialis]